MTVTLSTPRLLLRPLTPDDLDPLAVLHAEPSFWRYPLGRGQTREETEAFLGRVLGSYRDHGFGLAAVVDRTTGSLTGWAGLAVPSYPPEILPAVEVGWRLGSAWRGRGYATEAGAAWVRWGFETLELERIVSMYEPDNVPSGQVMEKLGFELDLVRTVPSTGAPLYVTALTRGRWADLCREPGWPLSSPAPPAPSGRSG